MQRGTPLGLAGRVPWIAPSTHPATWTDLAALPLGAELVVADDRATVVCDAFPGFRFGNAMLLRRAPTAADAARIDVAWSETFARRAAVGWRVLQWETSDVADDAAPALDGAERDAVLRLDAPGPAPSRAAPWPCGPVATDADFDAVADAVIAAVDGPPAHAGFVRWRMGTFRDLVRRGAARWWAAWDGDVVASAAGLVGDAHLAGVQEVVTRPTHRRRGACAHILDAMVREHFDGGAATPVVCVTEPAGDAVRIYERAGFRRVGTTWSHVAPLPAEGPRR